MLDDAAPPHSIEAEQAVIGSLLIDPKAWARVERLAGDDFYHPQHRAAFVAIRELCALGKVADVVTVGDVLRRHGELESIGALAALARETPSAANIEQYAAVVRERSALRRLASLAADLGRAAADHRGQSAAELLGRAQERLLEIQSATRSGKGLVSTQQLAPELIDDLDRDSSLGLQVGLQDFDALTSGLEAGDLVVIAGRPGMGKTALLVTIAAHVAQSTPVAVFTAEMPAKQLMRRCLALTSEIPQGRLRRADRLTDADWSAITPAVSKLADRSLWIDDTSTPTMTHVRAECLSLKARTGLGLVVIDYVQLLQGRGANRYEQLRDVAYGAKALAKDLAVPVILLAQLNRGVEARDHKRPHLSDLRDSGAIEEAADIVGLLYSEGYYSPDFSMPYVLECRIEKHRNGERGECLWRFAGELSRMSVLEPGAASQYRQLRAKQQTRRGASDDL
jgi:replicative DNA helicase